MYFQISTEHRYSYYFMNSIEPFLESSFHFVCTWPCSFWMISKSELISKCKCLRLCVLWQAWIPPGSNDGGMPQNLRKMVEGIKEKSEGMKECPKKWNVKTKKGMKNIYITLSCANHGFQLVLRIIMPFKFLTFNFMESYCKVNIRHYDGTER